MIKNVGRLDQIIRAIIGLIFIYLGFIDKNIINDPLSSNIIGVVGIISLLVAIIRVCPLYDLVGVNTCKNQCTDSEKDK